MSSTHPDDQPEQRPPGREVVRTPDHSRVFGLLTKFQGMPLSSLDVQQELGIPAKRARGVLTDLAALSVVSVKDGPNQTKLYYVQEAL